MKRVLMGLVWFAVLYMGGCMLVGAIAGGMAGSQNPADVHEAAKVAAEQAVRPHIRQIVVVSLLLSVVGTITGFLPGTSNKQK